jgi:hypothetical protein
MFVLQFYIYHNAHWAGCQYWYGKCKTVFYLYVSIRHLYFVIFLPVVKKQGN